MAEIELTQHEANTLINMEKCYFDNKNWFFQDQVEKYQFHYTLPIEKKAFFSIYGKAPYA